MKRTLCLILTLNFLWIPLAFALNPPADSVDLARKFTFAGLPKSFQALRLLNASSAEIDEARAKIRAARPAEFVAHAGQTLLFVLTVAGLDLVFQEIKKSGEEKPSEEALYVLAGKAAKQILDSGGTWSSLASMGTATAVLDYPVAALTALIADPEAHKILFENLRKSILTTGGFIGFDGGAQLWTEATYLLTDAADFERVKSVWGVGVGSMRALLLNPWTLKFDPKEYAEHQRDLQLAGKMFANLFKVALLDQDLRAKWLNNSWRTRYMTGDFAVLLSSVLAAAAIGSVILPGGGTAVGFMFGVAGYGVSLLIPQEVKDYLTVGMQSLRNRMNKVRLNTNANLLGQNIAQKPVPGVYTEEDKMREMRRLLNARHNMRSDYLTINFEHIRMDLKKMFKNAELRAELSVSIHGTFIDSLEFLKTERAALVKLVPFGSAETKALWQEEFEHVAFLAKFIGDTATALEAALAAAPSPLTARNLTPVGQDMVKFVEISYSRGFNEDKLISLAN